MSPGPFPPYPVTEYPGILINAALVGGVLTKDRAPKVPITAEAIVADAESAVGLGASIVHIHVRDSHGRPEWRKEAYAEVILGIRERCPGVIICATTTGRDGISIDQRADVLALEGAARPDMASLALGSFNFKSGPSVTTVEEIEELARRIADAGVLPELEVFDLGFAAMARRLHAKGLIPQRPYANLILGSLNTAPADARSLLALVDQLPAGTIWAAGGLGSYQHIANALSVLVGGHVRTGLEDNPDRGDESGEPADNAWLVARAADFAREFGRMPLSSTQSRALLGL